MVARRHPRRKTKLSAAAAASRDRHELFAKEYLIDQNGTQAAIRAGYSPRSAHVTAARLLKQPNVRDIIDAAQVQAVAKLDLSRDRILGELAKIGFSNPLDYGRVVDGHFEFDLTETSRDQLAAVAELTTRTRYVDKAKGKKGDLDVLERHTKLKLSDKRMALVDLGRATGLFKDEGGDGQLVTFNIINLHIEEKPSGRAQAQPRGPSPGGGEEFVDPARTTAHLRRL